MINKKVVFNASEITINMSKLLNNSYHHNQENFHNLKFNKSKMGGKDDKQKITKKFYGIHQINRE